MSEPIVELVARMPQVLIVDDDDQVREMLQEFLADEGYEVRGASDGLKALDALRDQEADIVITDMIMPNKEGMETIQTVRKEYPHAKIIAISGGGRIGPETFLPVAKKLGADRTFQKPFQPNDLLQAIKELVGP